MKLEKFKEKDNKRIGIIVFTITCILLVSGVIFYRTFAIFEVRTNQNVIKGTVQDPGNLYFAFYQQNEETGNYDIQKEMPTKENGYVLDEEKSYCGVNGENNPNIKVSVNEDWKIIVSGVTTSRTKCNLYFTKGIFLMGHGVPVVEEGDGLYKVEHDDSTLDDEGWKKEEYRFAGKNPSNYVNFNNELWRIIGLVNVKTANGDIDQRLKIIRKDPIIANEQGFSWDYKTNGIGSSISEYGSNDWTDSQLMEMLNGIYYNSESGNCYQKNSTATTCNFTQSSSEVKGLNDTARKMIDKDIIWNLGGSSTYNDVTISMFYERERGTSVFTNGLPFKRETEWQASNTGKASLETTNQKVLDFELTLFQSIALPYPSDYGYATSGGTLGREECFKEVLYNLESESNYQSQCGKNNWLKPASGYMWTLSPYSYDALFAFWVDSSGCVGYGGVGDSDSVYPTLYLIPTLKISDGIGRFEEPFIIENYYL